MFANIDVTELILLMLNRAFHSLSSLQFWKSAFSLARFCILFSLVVSFLGSLSRGNQYVEFWLVAVVFAFNPTVEFFQQRRATKS